MTAVINEIDAWEYLCCLADERARSAVIALRIALLDFASPLGTGELASQVPVDMDVLSRAAVYAFHADNVDDVPPACTYAIGRSEAEDVLRAIRHDKIALRAARFLAEARLSNALRTKVDLLFLVNLFVRCVERCGISAIMDGTIGRESKRLEDPDNW